MQVMTIKKKLYLSYGALATIAFITSIIAIVMLGQMKTTVSQITAVNTAKLFDSGMINAYASDQLYSANAAMLRIAENDPQLARARIDNYVRDTQRLHEAMEDYKGLMSTEEEKEDYRTIVDAEEGMAGDAKEFESFVRQNKIDAAWPLYTGSLMAPLTRVHDAAEKMALYQQRASNAAGAEAGRRVLLANWTLCLMLIPIAAAGAIVLIIIRRLDAQLRQSIGELADGSEQVAGAASQVSSSSQMLAKDTSEQAAMIEETSATSEEINSMARRNAEHSKTAAGQMTELKQLMESGSREMETATQAMDDISQSSDKISRIIQVIEKIAFQTNILALNAAVEAARAGEAGKGFAVVADEVRNLAQQCAQAAQDTGVLIEQSQLTSKAGHLRVQKVAEETQKMSRVLDSMKELVDEINGGSQEQGRGIEQIGRAITQMEQGTQKSAANAEESAAAAEELTAQSSILRDVAKKLGEMVGSSESARVDHRPSNKESRLRGIRYNLTTARSSVGSSFLRNTSSDSRARRTMPESAGVLTSEERFPLEEAQFSEF